MFGRYYRRFNDSDPLIKLILMGAVVAAVIIMLPRLPGTAGGIGCENLPRSFITGNNQSILARQADPGDLTLELYAERELISNGESLVLWLRFNNASVAPFTLLMVPSEYLLRYTQQEAGISLAVQSATTGQGYGESTVFRPPFPQRTQFSTDDLRVLGPRTRCSLRIEVSAARLAAANMTQGDFFIVAAYSNRSSGTLPAVTDRTPTPVFANQGVWVGEVRSNQIQVRIVPAGTPQ